MVILVILVVKSKSMESQSECEEDTARLAAIIAAEAKAGNIYALHGDLGAGKTCFARGFIRALAGVDIDVPSPTFTLVQTYDTPRGTVCHFDLYRLKSPEDVLEIGWDDALAEAICLIEWPDRAGAFLPPGRTDITLSAGIGNMRRIKVSRHDV
jgi:tRNA threonylcarbamoyladenosine biosynthesis protein TsaE